MKKIVELVVKLENLDLDGAGLDAIAIVENPAIEMDFLYFNAEQKLYVDNTGMEEFKKFLDENKDTMKKPGGGPAGEGAVDHGMQMQILKENGVDTEYPFGYCFQIAQFTFYALGGYKGPYDLMCIKKMEYQVAGHDFQSTHWYVQSKEDGRIIDLSAEQFDGILDINEYYKDGRRANLGFPYYNVDGEKVMFDNTVPSLMTLKLYNKWREQYGELEGIEEFYQACKYEETRMSMQFSEEELPYVESFVKPSGNETESEFIGRCIPTLIDEGYEQDQAVAICYNYWQDGFQSVEEDKAMVDGIIDLLLQVDNIENRKEIAVNTVKQFIEEGTQFDLQDFMQRIGLQEFEFPEDTCWGGYEPYGTKIKDGRSVPNCIPVENNKYGINANLPQYVDETGPLKKKERMSEQQEWLLSEFEKRGEEYNPQDAVFVSLAPNAFSEFTDFLKGVAALDILGTDSNRQAERVYRYTGPAAERGFCRAMMRLNKVYRRNEIAELDGINPAGRPTGEGTYSVFEYKGGPNCTHYWEQLLMFKQADGRTVFIQQGAATGGPEATNAGMSNNQNEPSPNGAVANNAYRFSTDEEQRIVTGPAMVPNKMILRKDENGNPYYVYFTQKTVKDIAEKLFDENKQNLTNIEHNSKETHDRNTLLESWIVKDPEMDKAKALGFEVPVGTWMVSYKINDEETWAKIKSGKAKGFSVEGYFIEKAEAVRAAEQTYNYIMDILNKVQ